MTDNLAQLRDDVVTALLVWRRASPGSRRSAAWADVQANLDAFEAAQVPDPWALLREAILCVDDDLIPSPAARARWDAALAWHERQEAAS